MIKQFKMETILKTHMIVAAIELIKRNHEPMNVFKDRLEKKNIKKKTKCLLLTMLTLKANSVMKICRFPIQSYLKDNLHVLVSHFSVKHDFSFLEDIRSFLSMTHSVPQALCVI